MNGLPVRDSDDAVAGTWIEFLIERNGKRTYTNTFFTSLTVTADNVAAIARAGTRRGFFEALRFLTQWFCFPCWTALFETMLRQRPPPSMPWAEGSAPS